MIRLPKDFVMTKASGYFWNVVEKKLYSIKVTGELRPLALHKGGFFYGRKIDPGYAISVNGVRRRFCMDYLNTLKPSDEIQEIKVAK